MSRITDFRKLANFSSKQVDKCGTSLGKGLYPKLYLVENSLRVIVHSVLTNQLGSNWWTIAVDPRIQRKIAGFQNRHQARPWHTNPGKHEIYYTDFSDLTEIIRVNAHLLSPAILDINQWIAKIETIRLPRNVVAHMNFLNAQDRNRIDVVYKDLQILINQMQTSGSINLQMPAVV
jgi:hypothetical protein